MLGKQAKMPFPFDNVNTFEGPAKGPNLQFLYDTLAVHVHTDHLGTTSLFPIFTAWLLTKYFAFIEYSASRQLRKLGSIATPTPGTSRQRCYRQSSCHMLDQHLLH